jgi:hypothetical protein
MSEEMGYPFIPFHLDVFRAIRVAVEARTKRTFGFRLHCGEDVPFPSVRGSNAEAREKASHMDADVEKARDLHLDIVGDCLRRITSRAFSHGTLPSLSLSNSTFPPAFETSTSFNPMPLWWTHRWFHQCCKLGR